MAKANIFRPYVVVSTLFISCIVSFQQSRSLLSRSSVESERRAYKINTIALSENSVCSASWGIFSSTSFLTETQTNSPSYLNAKPRFETKSDINNMFIDPTKKFAFCSIPKNACSQWATVLPKVFFNNARGENQGLDYHIYQKSLRRYGDIKVVNKLFRNPNATRVVMIRDPLARLVSAYLDKCFTDGCTSYHCYARDEDDDGKRVSFRKVLDWILDNSTDVSQLYNPHWRLQAYQCGLKKNIDLYTIIGLMSKKTLSRDGACIMEKAGLERFNVGGPPDENGTVTPFWKEHAEMTVGASKNHYRLDDEEEILKKLFTPDYARRAVQVMHEDYELFHLPIPSWIPDATGEWLDSTDHHDCRGHPKEKQRKSKRIV